MNKIFTLLALLFCFTLTSQTVSKTYVSSTAVFPNPEKGFYKYASAKSNSYTLLNQTNTTNFRLLNNITLMLREFRLYDFKTGPISQTYLNNMQADFNVLRNAGMKCIVRFVYSTDSAALPYDASKATILSHIQQLKPYLIANSDIICLMQAGFIGLYGEWYTTSQAEFGGPGYNGLQLTTANYNSRKEVVDAILNALPTNRTVQIRTPWFKSNMYGTAALTDVQAFNGSGISRISHHNDCFLASDTDQGTYRYPTVELPYLRQETKYLAMGGETCKVNLPRSGCASALAEMADLHWSYLNNDYNTSVISGFTTNNCFNDIQKKLGYRFELTSAVLPASVKLGTTIPITLKIKNTGFAAPFNERKAYIILKNVTTNQVFQLLLNSDPRKWLGPTEITITQNLTLPAGITIGNYKMYLSLPDNATTLATRPEYAIRFANENTWESTTGYNSIDYTLNIKSATARLTNSPKFNLNIYPVPANNSLTIELNAIENYKVSFYNNLGQKISPKVTTEKNQLQVDIETLSNGIYFVDIDNGSYNDTRKFIVNH